MGTLWLSFRRQLHRLEAGKSGSRSILRRSFSGSVRPSVGPANRFFPGSAGVSEEIAGIARVAVPRRNISISERIRGGGRIALSPQKVRAEHEIAGALRFPTGRGAQAGFTWSAFRAALNDFGRALPRFQDGVLSRAERALRVNRTWFVPNSYDAAQRS